MPPMVIHKGDYVWDNWTRKAPGNIRVAATSKGYMSRPLFLWENRSILCRVPVPKPIWFLTIYEKRLLIKFT